MNPSLPVSEAVLNLSLETPVLNTSPLPDYGKDGLDYGMVIGLERTTGGQLWACWVGGGDNEKAFFVLARSADGGGRWSDPLLVIDPHRADLPFGRRTIVGNLWLDPKGRLWLFFDQALGYFDGRAGTWFTRCDDPDAVQPVWSEPERIWHGCALNKPLLCSNGEWLMVFSLWDRGKIPEAFADQFHDLDAFRMANVFVSSDEGRTWQRRGGVAFPHPEFDEAHLIERKDGSLWITGRTHVGMWESESMDRGRTWSEPQPSAIVHVNSRHFLRRLQSGRLLLVKHGKASGERPSDVPYGPGARSLLTAFLSEDDGLTWQGGLLLDERDGISYPDGTQLPDGAVYIAYDFDRDHSGEILFARFREEDVLAGKTVSPQAAFKQLINRADPEAVARRYAGKGRA